MRWELCCSGLGAVIQMKQTYIIHLLFQVSSMCKYHNDTRCSMSVLVTQGPGYSTVNSTHRISNRNRSHLHKWASFPFELYFQRPRLPI